MSVKGIYWISFLDAIGMSIILTLSNPHILKLGGSLSLGGILNSVSSGAQLVASPIIGSWSDTRGRKLLLVITMSLVCFSNVLSGFQSIPLFFMARILYGIAHQTDPLLRALLIDIMPEDKLTDSFNKNMAVMGLAFIVGPVLAGAVYQFFEGFAFLSAIMFLLNVLIIGITLYAIEESNNHKDKKDTPPKETQVADNNRKSFLQSIYSDLIKIFSDLANVNWSQYGDILTIKFLSESAFSLVFLNMGVIFMEIFSFTQTQMGLAIAFISINMIVSTFIAGFLTNNVYKSDKSGYTRLLHAFSIFTLSLGGMVFANTATLYLSVFVPLLAAKALFELTWTQILSSRTTESDKGVMMGAAASMISLSGLICPLFGGVVGDYFGINSLVILPVFPAVVGVGVLRKVKQRLLDVKHDKVN